MSTVGNTGTPGSGWALQGLNVNTQAWSNFTMPSPGGWIKTLHAYFDAEVTSGNGYLVLWVGGAVFAKVAVNGIPVGSNSAGGQAWHQANLATPVYVKGGTSLSLGFWMPGACGFVFSSESGGSSSWNGVGYSSPGSQSGSGSTGVGALGAYADYVPNKLKVRRSGAWVEAPLQVRRSGAWVPATPLNVRRSGAWTQVQ